MDPVAARPSNAAPSTPQTATKSTEPPQPAAVAAEPTPQAAPDPGMANLDRADDYVVGPPDVIADCEARLSDAGVRFRAGKIPLTTTKSGATCGAPQIIVYEAGPSGARWNAPPLVTCQLALGLARFE